MNREAVDRFCERGILAFVLTILAWGPLATAAVRTQEFIVILALTAVVLVLWVVRLWAQENPKLLFPPVCWVVAVFAGYAIWRYFVCDIEYVGRLELLRILVYAFLFFAVINNLHRQETIQIICFSLIFLAMALSLLAIVQWLTRINKVPSLSAVLEWLFLPQKIWYFARLYGDRASGTYINPNHLAGLLEMLLPLALAFTLVGRSKPVTKVFLGYASLVIVAGIGTTVSRGSWIATGLTLVLFFAILATSPSYRLPALGLLIVVAAGSSFFITRTDFFKERFRLILESKNLEKDTRTLLWRSTMEMWQDHQWTGVGPGHFNYRFRAYRPMDVQLQPDRAHNEYLNLLADWGVVGAAFGGMGIIIFFWGVLRSWRYVRRGEREFKTNFSNKFAVVLGGTFGLIALLGHSFTDFNLQIPANAVLMVTLVAVVSSHLRFASEKYWKRVGRVLQSLMTLLLIAGAAGFLYQTLRLGREYLWLERAAIESAYSDAQIYALSNAWRMEPRNFETTYGIGESYRIQSSDGGENYRELATNAVAWFSRGTNCNPHDERNYLGLGWCLDWQGRASDSAPYFDRADQLDANGYTTCAMIARHYRFAADFPAARAWAERSLKLKGDKAVNTIAAGELYLANREMLRAANEGQKPIP
jgi:O-antigen ligase